MRKLIKDYQLSLQKGEKGNEFEKRKVKQTVLKVVEKIHIR